VNNKVIIGVDVGGTKIMTGAINKEGKVICEPIKVSTGSNEPTEMIVKRITDSVEKIMGNLDLTIHDVLGIGLGVTGPLDINHGIILECPQLPTMHFYPLRKAVEDYFHIPVNMNNDANCLIYGEAIWGAGKDKKNVVGFTLGTGIGCAIILDKKLLNGSTGTACEVWVSPYGSGYIEEFVSGEGVRKIFKSISGENKSSLEIFNLAKEGNENALRTWKEFGKHLSVAIAWSINLIDPEVIILGGSISNAYKFFAASMEENLRKNICSVPAEKTKVVLAALGDYAGFVGAAALVLSK